MNANNTNTETNKYLFVNLVTMLSMSAMQQLGKIINPAAGKAEINLDAAQATIDTLDMLSAKTLGNLDKDEARLMKDTLSTLKLNFVETREEEEQKKAQSGKGTEAHRDGEKQSRPEPQTNETSEPESGSEQTNDPKFHKSYN